MVIPIPQLDIRTTTGCTKNKDKDTYETYWGKKKSCQRQIAGEREKRQ